MKTSSEFTQQSIYYLSLNPPRIEKCLLQLSEDQVWKKPNANTNSIGNLILHLCGNITQYAHASLGNEKDLRKRDLEFSTEGGFSKKELLEKITIVTEKAIQVIENISDEELLRMRNVQGFHYSGISIIIHITEHFSYHVGQIAFFTKLLCNKDLGFYEDFDLSILNK
ncbi:MAG: DinB family protein [Saprospiraceae bacterium]